MTDMKIGALAPWFGGDRAYVRHTVAEMGQHRSYWELFGGGFSTVLGKPPSSHETVIEKHADLTNLARIVRDDMWGLWLYRRLARTLCCQALFEESKAIVLASPCDFTEPSEAAAWRAYHYFVMSWMGRNGVSGTGNCNQNYAIRYTHGGGHGGVRFASAADSARAWHNRLRRVTILTGDSFDVLPKIQDDPGTVIYADPPFLREGHHYLHSFTPAQHRQLSKELNRFQHVRVVLRYYDDPELADLYPEWTKVNRSRHKKLSVQARRGSKGKVCPEILLINGPSLTAPEPQVGLFAETR